MSHSPRLSGILAGLGIIITAVAVSTWSFAHLGDVPVVVPALAVAGLGGIGLHWGCSNCRGPIFGSAVASAAAFGVAICAYALLWGAQALGIVPVVLLTVFSAFILSRR